MERLAFGGFLADFRDMSANLRSFSAPAFGRETAFAGGQGRGQNHALREAMIIWPPSIDAIDLHLTGN